MNAEMRLCSVNLKNGTVNCFERVCLRDLYEEVGQSYGVSFENFYVIKDGKKVGQDEIVDGLLHLVPRLVGGKGGFGSMLRAIGAQIEKTTNREACRDLSGRRLRDINEEQRLKNWIAQQAEREREAAERKKKKIERLCKEPKHDFKDEIYEKERSELTDKVSSSVEEGFRKAGTSGTSNQLKRTHTVTSATVKKKKKKLWIDADDLSSSDSDDSDTVNIDNVQKDRTEKAEGQSTS